ncbi:MAG: PqqD family protein [Magnetococcales bacterium]|nr:PqqD family protein [Magnetococcales bacterium]
MDQDLLNRRYGHGKDLTIQMDMTIPEGKTLMEALNDPSTPWLPGSAMDTVMVVAHGNEIHELNLVGALIFECLGAGWNNRRIITAMCQLFGIGEPEAQSDFIEFISAAMDKELLQANT